MKRDTFAVSITMLASGLPPRKPLEDAAMELYWLALQDLTDAEFKTAVGRAAQECTFLPAPAELRELARPTAGAIVEASMAWDAVRMANRRISWTTSQIDFGPHVNAVLRQMGGWDAICRADVDDLDLWKRKEFERLYVEFAGKQIGDMGRALVGPADAKGYGAHVVPIAGIPSQPVKALGPSGGVSELVRGLAEAKS